MHHVPATFISARVDSNVDLTPRDSRWISSQFHQEGIKGVYVGGGASIDDTFARYEWSRANCAL